MKVLFAVCMLALGADCVAQPAWRNVASYPSSQARSFVVLPGVGVAVAAFQDGVWFSSDGLESWSHWELPFPVVGLVSMGADSLLVVQNDPQPAVCRFRAGDTTWERLRVRDAVSPLLSIAATERYLFAAESGQVWRTRRDSIAWEKILRPVPSRMFRCVAAYDDGLVVVGGMTIVVSKDEGRSWDTALAWPGRDVLDVVRLSRDDLCGVLTGAVAISRDGGRSFSLHLDSLLEGVLDLAVSDSGDLWGAGGYRGVVHSTDGGASWLYANHGVRVDPCAIAVMGSMILAGSDRNGLFALETAAGSETQSITVSSSIHPIPAVDQVEIDVGYTATTPVDVYVVDALGELRLRRKLDVGVRRFRMSVDGLPSGAYEVLIRMSHRILRQRLVVAR